MSEENQSIEAQGKQASGPKLAAAEGTGKVLDALKIQKKAGEKNRKVKLNDRVHLRITKTVGAYREGMEIKPHRVYAEQLLADKIAVEVKKKSE